MEKTENKRRYKSKWFLVIILILICPIGIFLMWKNKLFNNIFRISLSVIAIPYSFIGLFFWIGALSKNSEQINKMNDNIQSTNIESTAKEDTDENEEIQDKNINDYVVGEPEFLELYLKQNKIEKIDFQEEKELDTIEEKLKNIDTNSNELKYLDSDATNENTIEEKFKQYKITINKTNVMYLGGLKDNKPNGIGAVVEVIEYNDTKLLSKKYIGNFKNGYFSGYGKLYNIPLQEDYGGLERVQKVSKSKDQNYINKRLNGLIYEGEFDNGTISGSGNEFDYLNLDLEFSYREQLDSDMKRQSEIYQSKTEESKKEELDALSKRIENGFAVLNNPVTIFCGTYKNGKLNGNGKAYNLGKLYYDGEFEDNQRNGYGVIYFENSDVIQYKGQFLEGKADGKGILYDKDGNTIYSGEFKNGDYKQN